jgi:hypothetical protein
MLDAEQTNSRRAALVVVLGRKETRTCTQRKTHSHKSFSFAAERNARCAFSRSTRRMTCAVQRSLRLFSFCLRCESLLVNMIVDATDKIYYVWRRAVGQQAHRHGNRSSDERLCRQVMCSAIPVRACRMSLADRWASFVPPWLLPCRCLRTCSTDETLVSTCQTNVRRSWPMQRSESRSSRLMSCRDERTREHEVTRLAHRSSVRDKRMRTLHK